MRWFFVVTDVNSRQYPFEIHDKLTVIGYTKYGMSTTYDIYPPNEDPSKPNILHSLTASLLRQRTSFCVDGRSGFNSDNIVGFEIRQGG